VFCGKSDPIMTAVIENPKGVAACRQIDVEMNVSSALGRRILLSPVGPNGWVSGTRGPQPRTALARVRSTREISDVVRSAKKGTRPAHSQAATT
jgi:hypothetical protein